MSVPNIVFILCDDLGVNDLNCYGREDHNTPNLDRLARQGTRFTSAYASQAICSASRAGLLTGLNPARLHLTTFLPGRKDMDTQRVLHPEITMHIPLSTPTLPKYLKSAGYKTGFVGKWHVGDQPGPKEHGFDVVIDGQPHNSIPSETEGGKSEYLMTSQAIGFIEENQSEPFALYLGHHTPHITYDAKPHLIEKNAGAFEPVYAALIETLDDTIGLIMQKLDDLNLSDNTIFVFTSDNGGLHVPEGGHDRVTHNTPFRAGKGYTYEGGQRVPLIVRWPGHIPEGRVIDTPINNTGWVPTLMELAGAALPEGLDGESFAGGLLGGEIPEKPIYWHFPHYTNQGGRPSGAMRDGDWLLIERYDEDKVELYDLSRDIGEREDLSAQKPGKTTEMVSALSAWRDEVDVQFNRPNPDCDEAAFQRCYIEMDPSEFDPLTADEVAWQGISEWRNRMDKAKRLS
ncbi:sulfatase [Kiritimatiellaeota bacterium B1221]|nr:sulfatase [Kiritimatiellaeota bacterium B1221]